MGSSGWFLLLLSPLTIFTLSDAVHVYIKVAPIVHGEFGNVSFVTNPELCGAIVVEDDSLGYEIDRIGAFNYSCRLIEKVDFFDRRENISPTAFPYYYLVDKREEFKCPNTTGPYQLSDILEAMPGCEQNSNPDCKKLKDVAAHCKNVKQPECIGKAGYPDGQKATGVGASCRSAIKLWNGMDYCCPTGTIKVGWHENYPVCCPSNMVQLEKKAICCPGGFEYKESFQKCIGRVSLGEGRRSQTEVNSVCKDWNAEPVKVENDSQNEVVKGTVIGLQIPENSTWAQDGFRWASDNSTPEYTNWFEGEPDGQPDVAVFVVVDGSGKWRDKDHNNLTSISCMVDFYLGQRS
ncbi:hypothetical protein QR680_008151 [Steinernema hermaphroditum]|uniref:C-type lectin domain-containing protein n=1 Tax=Steinernema hermaphroditum TaxID=289476 RepID=A0AA39IH49_9BILA|nr:hypothetical protein QR680_008151 [Steinernema hermaphroditum]